MSNSPLVDYVCLSPNYTPGKTHEIDTVTIHCVVGQCTVESLGYVFANPARRGSSNYGVDKDGRIGLYVEEKNRAWTSGGSSTIFINGISGSMNDQRAITIEVASDTFKPYAVTSKAMEGLIRLLVDICQRNPKIHRLRWKNDKSLVGQVQLQNMTAHRWFAPTDCPGNYLYQRFGEIANEVNKRLDEQEFKDNQEDENMTVEKFTELFLEMRKGLQDNDASEYSKAARDWATSTGLIKGGDVNPDGTPNNMWEDLLTREQMATVLYRFELYD